MAEKLAASSRYAQFDENSGAEGAVGYDVSQPLENFYETICNDPASPGAAAVENIYETIEDVRLAAQAHQQQINAQMRLDIVEEPIYDIDIDQPSCSSTYGRIGNAYGRIDIIGHGIGRIERHLSSSCGSINSNHTAIENTLYGACRSLKDSTGRISKVSVQWLLANKWLPLWIANTENGQDYKIIDFLIAQGLERDDDGDNSDNENGDQKQAG